MTISKANSIVSQISLHKRCLVCWDLGFKNSIQQPDCNSNWVAARWVGQDFSRCFPGTHKGANRIKKSWGPNSQNFKSWIRVAQKKSKWKVSLICIYYKQLGVNLETCEQEACKSNQRSHAKRINFCSPNYWSLDSTVSKFSSAESPALNLRQTKNYAFLISWPTFWLSDYDLLWIFYILDVFTLPSFRIEQVPLKSLKFFWIYHFGAFVGSTL